MKIWKGPEMEGPNKDIMTLFVKDESLSGEAVIRYLKQNPDCKRVYLGAGRTDVKALWPTNDEYTANEEMCEMFRYCNEHDITTILETSVQGIRECPENLWDQINEVVIRVHDDSLGNANLTDYIKLDTNQSVYICKIQDMIHTDLKTLSKDVFSVDVVLFNDEKEDKQ